jgi:hypothetical protein
MMCLIHRTLATTMVLGGMAAVLAGCSGTGAGPAPGSSASSPATSGPPPASGTPDPSASASASPSPTMFPTDDLPTTDVLLDQLGDSGDASVPTVRLVSTADATTPALLGDGSSLVTGPKSLRVACATLTGSDIEIVIAAEGRDPVAFTAPCGTGLSTFASDGPNFEGDVYTITATPTEPAVVATGVSRL